MYGILHVQKFKASDITGLECHTTRSKKSLSNPDIDYSRSSSNWWPKPCPSLHTAVKKRLDQRRTTKKLRDDAVVMVNTIITASPDFFKTLSEDKLKAYFEDALSFLEQKYGPENVVAAVVHMDEATPHMHVSMVPMTLDFRICAKDLFDKKRLQALQDDFFTEVSSLYGLKRGGDGEKKRHLTEREYKLQKQKEALEKEEMRVKDRFKELLETDPATFKNHLSKVMQNYERLQKNFISLRKISEELKEENDFLKKENDELKEDLDYMMKFFQDDLTDDQINSLVKMADDFREQNKETHTHTPTCLETIAK